MTKIKGILGVIPARLASTRLPAKVLAPISGKPMVWWVWKKASHLLVNVVVATDHSRVKRTLEALGVPVVMTSRFCQSGTERVAEVARRRLSRFYLNIQGDEPLMSQRTIRAVCRLMLEKRRGIFTAASVMKGKDSQNPHIVKVVPDKTNRAIYFSRSPVPYSPDPQALYWRHAGIYGYDRPTLLTVTALPLSNLEKREGLEQLRALDNGIPVWVARVSSGAPAVDTAADLRQVRQFFKGAH